MLTRSEGRWTRRMRALAGLVALGTAWGVSASAREQELPSGAALVAKYVAAIGGADAIRATVSFRATGVTELPAQNIKGTFEMIAARPAKSILRIELGGVGKAESGFNGEVGWSLDPMVGPSLVTGRMLDELRNDAHFEAALHPPDLVRSITTTARVMFDGRPAFKARVVMVSGQQRDQYFDVETGYLIGIEGENQTPMGVLPMTMTLRDYKAFGAITHPARVIQSAMGIEQHFIFERYEYNTLKADAFDPPAIIRAIIRTETAPPWRTEALASFDEAWTTINASFYDPAFGGLDWAAVRDELRPRIASAATAEAARAVIVEMLARLKRSHFVLMPAVAAKDDPAPAGDARVDIDVRVWETDVVITRVTAGSPAAVAGLAAGQLLLAVDDQAAASWWRMPAVDADPRVVALDVWRRAQRSLRGAPGSSASLRVQDGREVRVVAVPRAPESGERVVLGDLPPFVTRVTSREVETPGGRAVGVIGFNVWMTPVNDPLAREIDRYRTAKGLVIDLRGNPGGLAAMIQGVAGHVFTTPELLGRMKTRGSDLEFRANPRTVTPDGVRVEPYAGPVAILVDELTASASECFAGALQSLGRARVFGRQTMGQALPASTRRLSNGDLLMYVVGDFVTATGHRLEGDGVRPDEVVPFSLGALRGGRDATLDAALRWLDRV
ncbi:MAG: S41 family peptidase [Acidobacteria bacterium]|nr:S41 family peptidase [Acidobacteriota bacterium]